MILVAVLHGNCGKGNFLHIRGFNSRESCLPGHLLLSKLSNWKLGHRVGAWKELIDLPDLFPAINVFVALHPSCCGNRMLQTGKEMLIDGGREIPKGSFQNIYLGVAVNWIYKGEK